MMERISNHFVSVPKNLMSPQNLDIKDTPRKRGSYATMILSTILALVHCVYELFLVSVLSELDT